jgi:septum formation protein
MTGLGILPVVLATASARRRKILLELGVPFESAVPDVAEVHFDDDPQGSAHENALRKLQWACERFPGRRIITADTVIDFAGQCIGKPAGMEEAARMLRAFSGRSHRVLSAVGFTAAGAPGVRVVESVVTFRHLGERDISEYFTHVNPLDKAGAYDIDQHGECIVASYSGSYTNIMGLPREFIAELCKQWAGEPARGKGLSE